MFTIVKNTNSIFILLLLLCLSLPLTSNAALLPGQDSSQSTQTVSVPEDLSQEQVGDFVAPLGEQQVRDLLITNLKAQAASKVDSSVTESVSIIKLIKGINNPYTPLGGGVARVIAATETFGEELIKSINIITGGEGITGLLKMLGILLLLIVSAWLVEYACLYRWSRSDKLVTDVGDLVSWKAKLGYPFLSFIINFFGLIIFAIAGYIMAYMFLKADLTSTTVTLRIFDSFVAFRLFTLLFKLFLYPPPNGLDLIDRKINKHALFRCMVSFTFFYVVVFDFIVILAENGFPQAHFAISAMIIFGLIINPIVIWFIWAERYDVDRILFGNVDSEKYLNGVYKYAARAAIWPSVVTFVILLAFTNWQIQFLIGNEPGRQAIEVAWWLALLFPVIDLMVSSLLDKLISLEIFQHQGFQQRKQRFIFIIRGVVRLILLVVMFISLFEAWGFKLLAKFQTAGGLGLVNTLIDIGVTVLIGFILWEAIQIFMERNLPSEPEEGVTELDGEGGGAAASRSETLLPLFKTILLIILLLVVIMSILYSLGVQIGPLLAGAGVVGIAIGFGSQKLVHDIISGMFFLFDDAFRKGEYVEVAGLRGTVEKLSVRSMRLRHHLGAVQTIPYGEVTTVKNLSRDWVTMKLELRLAYDVDIEKVRKIIKKVGLEMMQDEEIGPNLLAPLKSQGVMRVEESALIFRMKFTAKPGEQWIVRRVAYTNVRNALLEAGIEFAHREVKVRLPDELEKLQKLDFQRRLETKKTDRAAESENTDGTTKTAVVSAAAMSAIIASEIAAQDKIDDDTNGDE